MSDQVPAATTQIPEGKVSLKDIPVESNNFRAPETTPPMTPPADTDPAKPVTIVDPPPPPPADDDDTPPADEQPPAPTPEELIATEEDIQAQLEFFAEVDKVRGETIQVDYGDVVPSSLEGIVIRERAIEQNAYAKYQRELQQRDPRGAAYLLHRMTGGTDEEFFARKTLSLPEYDVFKEDVDLQKQIYKNGLLKKGLSAATADRLVDMAVSTNSLLAEADAQYQNQVAEDQAELARLTQLAEQDALQYQQKLDGLDKLINDTLKAPDLKVVIPDKEQRDFNNFLRSFIQTDGKDFFIAQPIDATTAKAITESLFIQFKKGDLSSVIARQANTMVTKRNQIALGASRKAQTAPPPAPVNSNKKTLGEFKFPGEQ